MAYRCDCCGIVQQPKTKAFKSTVAKSVIKTVTTDDGPVQIESPYVTEETRCEICHKGKELGIPDSILQKMAGKPLNELIRSRGSTFKEEAKLLQLAIGKQPPPIKVRKSKPKVGVSVNY